MTMYRALWVLASGVLWVMAGTGCNTVSVKRTEADKVIDLSGRWNDTDAQLVAQEMIKDSLERAWIEEFRKGHEGKKPVVVVGALRNKSHEHIDTEVFTKSFEKELINSGQVRVVAESQLRENIREERKSIQLNSDPATIKKFGMEVGADFILLGVVSTVKDEIQGQYVMYYQTNLELINIETNEKGWIGEKKIKKLVKRSKLSL